MIIIDMLCSRHRAAAGKGKSKELVREIRRCVWVCVWVCVAFVCVDDWCVGLIWKDWWPKSLTEVLLISIFSLCLDSTRYCSGRCFPPNQIYLKQTCFSHSLFLIEFIKKKTHHATTQFLMEKKMLFLL